MRNLNLDQLQTLVAIADLGTLAAAAQALHLAAPTISLHLSELESRIGATLVHRGRRQASLTSAGELLVQKGRRLLADADDMLDEVKRRADGHAGLVRLGTTAGVSPLLLPQALEALARERPGVNVKLEVLGSEASMARLRAGTIDIAIVALPQKATPGVKLVPWRRDQMVAFLPAGWKVPARITPQWLAEHGWMGFDASTQMHKLIAAWFGRAGLNPRPSMEVNYPLALKSLAAAGQGVAVLPLEDPLEARSGAGLQVRPLSPLLMRELALAHRTAEPHEAAVAGVLQTLKGFTAITRLAR